MALTENIETPPQPRRVRLFAEDAAAGRILTDMIASRRADPEEFDAGLGDACRTARRALLRQRASSGSTAGDGADVIPCTREELRATRRGAARGRAWSAILGRCSSAGDPDKRRQLGGHYTDREKILMVVEPVVLDPLRREFAAMRERVEELAEGVPGPATTPRAHGSRADAEDAWRGFLERLRRCGCWTRRAGQGTSST